MEEYDEKQPVGPSPGDGMPGPVYARVCDIHRDVVLVRKPVWYGGHQFWIWFCSKCGPVDFEAPRGWKGT